MGSVTWDRELEMVQHMHFRIAMGVAVYFCDPQSR
jgi:IS30 family transposase